MSGRAFARRLGMTAEHLSRLETGRRTVSPDDQPAGVLGDRFEPGADPKMLWWPGHRPTDSFGVCSPPSRRVASLRPRFAGLAAWTAAPRTPVQTGHLSDDAQP